MTVNMLAPDMDGKNLRITRKCRGAIGFVLGLVLIKALPLNWLVAGLGAFKRVTRTPTPQEVEQYIRAVRWASKNYPGRAACLETSLGAWLAGALTLKVPTWCIGARFKPLGFHAWVEVNDQPILEPESEQWPYKAAVQI